MSGNNSRRDFLKFSALAIAATATPEALSALPAAAEPASDITVWITNDALRFSRSDSISWRKAGRSHPTEVIQLNPANKFQEILGFGGAFTDATCYVFSQLSPAAREELFHEMFHPSEMALNVCRTCIGSSDYSTKAFSYDEGDADPEMARFSIDHDRAYILPMLREARKVNPDLFLFSSPWSPPGWMKFNQSMLGGSMRNKYLGAYAQYFLKFLQGYAAEGVPGPSCHLAERSGYRSGRPHARLHLAAGI